MSKLYKDLIKLPDSEKEVYFFDKNGVRKSKTVKITDRYLLVNARGDSIAVTSKELSKLGISTDGSSKEVVDITDDNDENPEVVETNSSPNTENGENKNG